MKLQVPEEMAGVTGPCPQCSATIIAPQPKEPIAAAPIPSSQPAPVQPQAQQPVQQPVQPQQPAPLSSSQVEQPVSQPAPVSAPAQPEPSISSEAPMVNKVRRDSQGGPPRRSRWMRVVFPLAFLLIAAILVMVVLNAAGFVNLWDLDEIKAKISGKPAATAPATTPTPAPAAPASPTSPTIPETEPKETVNPPVDATPSLTPPEVTPAPKPVVIPTPSTSPPPEGEFPDLTPPTPTVSTSPPGSEPVVRASPEPATSADPKSPPKAGSLVKGKSFEANEVLDEFLNAESLDERLPLMAKSKYKPEQLAKSSLAGKLKPVKSNYFADMMPRLEDDMRQYRYYVSFEDETEERDRLLMVLQVVERPGIHPPKVNGDVFIEHYEKKLDFYGLNPNKDATTFHCIAEARTADLAKGLPEDLKNTMIRMVVKTHPRGKPAFDAFLSKNSPLMDRIGPRGDFPYVEARFCILTFRWNTTRPKQPFIELIDIVAMGWER